MTQRYMITLYVLLYASRLSSVAAQTFIDPIDPGFHPPPLQQANIAFYVLFTLATLAQLGIVVSYLFRGHSPHLLPGIGALVALLFQIISHAVAVAFTVAEFTYGDDGGLVLTANSLLEIQIPYFLFSDWVVPFLFFAITLVLRDGYIAFTRNAALASSQPRILPIFPFTVTSCFLMLVIFITTTAEDGLLGAFTLELFNEDIDGPTYLNKTKVVARLDHTFVGFDAVATIFLIGYAYVVRRQTNGDKIASMTVFAIVPLYCLNMLARIIYQVLDYHLPDQTADQLDFSSTVIYGTSFFAIGCILVHFFLYPKLWIGPGEIVPARYVGYPPQYPYGVQPIAQFPGQWGFPGQPSQNPPGINEMHQPEMGVYSPPRATLLTHPSTGAENASTQK